MTVRVVRDRTAPLRHQIHVGRYSFATDGTVEEGGDGSGPNPHDLYDSALGACKALTLLWYAKKKGIALDDIAVSVERDASAERAGTYRLSAEIAVTGNVTEAQRAELLRVVQKCPIHKLMTEVTTEITTSLTTSAQH